MQILVLGSAAGGGFPQWNCFCRNCRGVRDGSINAKARTQSSIAVSADGQNWVLINASPDLRQQINQSPQLWPPQGARGSNIRAVVLCDSQIDHTAGLLTLREGLPLDIYCSDVVYQDLTGDYGLLAILKHWHGGFNRFAVDAESGEPFEVAGVKGLDFYPVVLQSNAPPYSPYRDKPVPGNNLGLKIVDRSSGKYVFYAPGIAYSNDIVESAIAEAECVLIDGTLWLDDEMIALGVGKKRGFDMGHMPVNGPEGVVALLDRFELPRKVLLHINNTNPILDEDSPQHHYVLEHGIEIAHDGMCIEC